MKVANKVALEAEKDNDAAQKELQELQRMMEPKRARTHAVTTDDDEECEKQSCDDWELPDHSLPSICLSSKILFGEEKKVPIS